jgi:hypothetical protein
MGPDKKSARRAAAGEAGAASFPEQASMTVDAATGGANGCARRFGSVHVCRAGFAGRGTTLALPTGRHTLAFRPDPRQGLGSN